MKTLRERFDAKWIVWPPTGCWLWMGTGTPTGYGQIGAGSRGAGMIYAHRAAYELYVGPIPDGMEIDHLCRVRRCVNPSHIEPVLHRDNLLRGDTVAARHAASVRCPLGHPYSENNTLRSREGSRRCRECHRSRWR